MQRFSHGGSIACVATYLGTNGFNSTLSSCDKQVPIRYSNKSTIKTDQKAPLKKFSYVIIGCGVSGTAALGEILLNTQNTQNTKNTKYWKDTKAPKDETRDILVIDSFRNAFTTLEKSDIMTKTNINRIQCMEGSVVDMNLPSRELTLSDGTTVGYDNCLISVGTSISNLELGEKMLADDCIGDLVDMTKGSSMEKLKESVREGRHVSLIGADTWGVISIASELADYSRLNGFRGTISIITPSPGVMASSLPRYLSVALGKRLNTKGVELVPYSQVRYIGGPSTFAIINTDDSVKKKITENNGNNGNKVIKGSKGSKGKGGKEDYDDYDYSSPQNAKIGIYLSRVYDSLNTSMLYTDIVAMFPSSAPIAIQGNCDSFYTNSEGQGNHNDLDNMITQCAAPLRKMMEALCLVVNRWTLVNGL